MSATQCSLLILILSVRFDDVISQRIQGHMFDISQVVHRQPSLPSSNRLMEPASHIPMFHQRRAIGPRVSPMLLRRPGHPFRSMLRLHEAEMRPSSRRWVDPGRVSGFARSPRLQRISRFRERQLSRAQSPRAADLGHGHETIFTRNLQMIDSTVPQISQRDHGGHSGQSRRKGFREQQPRSERVGLISVDDIIALADAISKLRGDGTRSVGSSQGNQLNGSQHPASRSQAPGPPKKTVKSVLSRGQSVVSRGKGKVARDTANRNSATRPSMSIGNAGSTVAIDTVSSGTFSLAPPVISSGVQRSRAPNVGRTSLFEVMAPLALLQRNENERKNFVNHLMADPLFMAELMKTGNNTNMPINMPNLASLVRSGTINTGNREHILEEMQENLKQQLIRQVESQLDNRRSTFSRRSNDAIVIPIA